MRPGAAAIHLPQMVALRSALRLLALAALTGALHVALLYLWDPRAAVRPPRHVTPARAQAGLAAGRAAPRPGGHGGDPHGEVALLFGGDTAPTDAANTLLYQQGFEYPFSATLDLLRAADLVVVNLEAPVTERLEPFALYKRYSYRVAPAALPALRWAGVDVVSLANNHLLDYGPEGLRDTLAHLRAAGLAAVGAGRDVAEARRGAVLHVRGVRVGLVSYLEDSLMHTAYVRSFAWGAHPGVARLGLSALRQDLARLRREADVVIVLAHWGRSYEGVTLAQRLYAEQMIAAGADAVIGHHPHVAQAVAVLRGRPVLFSLGNYAFGTPGREWLRHGLLARRVLRGRRLRRVELIPLLVQNREVQFKPERLTGDEARQVLGQLARDSAAYGAAVRVRGDGVGEVQL